MNLNDPNWLLIGFLALCVLPLIIVLALVALAFVFGRRFFRTFFNPDITELSRYYEQQRARNPRATTEQLLNQVIRRQAFRCGVVGAITGLGGLITLPIALPVDIILSLRMQAAMVEFIAHLYGHGRVSETESRIRTYLVMSGGRRVSQAAFEAVMKFLLRVIGKSFSKLIPVIGAAVSFAVDYAVAQGVGRLALRHYGGQAALQQ
jgi:hypothetical protein